MVRRACGIKQLVLPPGFDPAAAYDKWGNRVWPSGMRSAGPLMDDVGARRALERGRMLHLVMPADYRE